MAGKTKPIKLLKGKVIAGSVWPKGSTPPVDARQARALVDAGEAEYVKTTASQSSDEQES